MSVLLFFRRLRSLCLKELLIIFKDPANRLVLIIPVVIQSFIFGYAATYDLNVIPYVICDQSRSALSRDLTARLDGSGKFLRQATLASTAEAEEWIYDGKALLAVQIGNDFDDRILSGRTPTCRSFSTGAIPPRPPLLRATFRRSWKAGTPPAAGSLR